MFRSSALLILLGVMNSVHVDFNWLLNDLNDEFAPYIVNDKLEKWGVVSGLVSEIYNPEEN